MKTLEVDVVTVRRMNGVGNVKGFADVKLGEDVLVKGFPVMQGKKGLFVSMPRKAGKDGRWFDTLTLSQELKEELEERVLEAFETEAEEKEG